MRLQHREEPEEACLEDAAPAVKRALEAGLHQLQFLAILLEETRKTGGVGGSNGGDLPLHGGDVRGAIKLSAATEDEAVLWIEPHQFHLLGEGGAGRAHDLFEHARVEEKRRAEVEAESLRFDGGGAAADERQPLENANANARAREQNGRSQATRACADDDDVPLLCAAAGNLPDHVAGMFACGSGLDSLHKGAEETLRRGERESGDASRASEELALPRSRGSAGRAPR
ncbi:hypothetical protein BH20VER1_BH20VER1_17080 [soil metagenome]